MLLLVLPPQGDLCFEMSLTSRIKDQALSFMNKRKNRIFCTHREKVSTFIKKGYEETRLNKIIAEVPRVHWRGINRKTSTFQKETKWINYLQTLKPKGLHIELDIICFISNA